MSTFPVVRTYLFFLLVYVVAAGKPEYRLYWMHLPNDFVLLVTTGLSLSTTRSSLQKKGGKYLPASYAQN